MSQFDTITYYGKTDQMVTLTGNLVANIYTLSLSLSHTHTLSLSLSLSVRHSLSLSHTHTHTQTEHIEQQQTRTHKHTHKTQKPDAPSSCTRSKPSSTGSPTAPRMVIKPRSALARRRR